jgi:hypothetical protein
MFDLANHVVENVGEEEKREYAGKMREDGSYRGYKPRKFWVSFALRSRPLYSSVNSSILLME